MCPDWRYMLTRFYSSSYCSVSLKLHVLYLFRFDKKATYPNPNSDIAFCLSDCSWNFLGREINVSAIHPNMENNKIKRDICVNNTRHIILPVKLVFPQKSKAIKWDNLGRNSFKENNMRTQSDIKELTLPCLRGHYPVPVPATLESLMSPTTSTIRSLCHITRVARRK